MHLTDRDMVKEIAGHLMEDRIIVAMDSKVCKRTINTFNQ